MADDDDFGNGTRVFDFYRVSVTSPGEAPVPLQLTPVGSGSSWVDAKAVWRETVEKLDQLIAEQGPLAGVCANLKMKLVDRNLDQFVIVERILLRQAQEMRNYFMFLPRRNRLMKHIGEEFSELHQFLHKEKKCILTRLAAEQQKNLRLLQDREEREEEKEKGNALREEINDRFTKLHQILEVEEKAFTTRMESEEERKKRQLNEIRTTTKEVMQRLQNLTFEFLKKLDKQDPSGDTEISELQFLMDQMVARLSRPLIISADLSEEEFMAPVRYTALKVTNSVVDEESNEEGEAGLATTNSVPSS